MTSIGNHLYIENNSTLSNIGGLASLRSLGYNLYIRTNRTLPTCEAEALEDRLVAGGWTRTAYISGNDDAPACP